MSKLKNAKKTRKNSIKFKDNCWFCGEVEPDTTITVECDVPCGKHTRAHNVMVHFGCYMDIDQ